jgi:hypothetical protein
MHWSSALNNSQLSKIDIRATGDLELSLAKAALALGMRCASAQMRHRWQGLVARLLQRLHDSSVAAAARVRIRAAGGVFGKNMRKAFSLDQPEADEAGVALMSPFHMLRRTTSYPTKRTLCLEPGLAPISGVILTQYHEA